MDIGKLRHLVYIIRKEYTSDGAGGQVQTGQSRRAVWAAIKTASGTEAISDGAVTNSKTRTYVIRATDIKAADFIEADGEQWNISNIEALDDRPAYMLVYCRRDHITGA